MSKRVIPPTSVWLELETLETGEFGLGSGSVILPDEIDVEYCDHQGTLAIEDEDVSLILRGIKQ